MRDINQSLRNFMTELLKKEMKDIKIEEIQKLKTIIRLTEQNISREVFLSQSMITKIHQGLMKQAKDFVIDFNNQTIPDEKKVVSKKKVTKKKVTKAKAEKSN